MKPYYHHAGITIYHGDCRDILPQIPAGSVDLVLTDPPYGTGWVRGGGKVGEFKAVHEQPAWDVWSLDWLYLVSRPVAFFAPFSRRSQVEYADGIIWWHKTNPRPNGPDREPIFVLGKACGADLEFYNGDTPNHPCEKPLPLIKAVANIVGEDGPILDPFMGSGTTLVAAKQLGRRAIGIEIEERYCEIAVKRLAQEILPLEPAVPEPVQMVI